MFPTLPVRTSALAGPQGEVVKLWESMPGQHRGRTVNVSAERMAELRTAQDVIDIVKEHLAYGAGNLKSDFMLTSGESYHRSLAARYMREVDYRGDDSGLAKSAVSAQAGTCAEHSALAMAYLSNMDLDRPVFTYAAGNDADHQFNVIGDIREPKKAVVVDAWPTFAKAHLLNNATFQPAQNGVLDVHYPGMPAKVEMDDLASVEPLDAERLQQISQSMNAPSFREVLEQRPDIGLRKQAHGLQNLGVSYRNRDDETDVLHNVVDRSTYERQAQGADQARRYLGNS